VAVVEVVGWVGRIEVLPAHKAEGLVDHKQVAVVRVEIQKFVLVE
jgi:hypothetical protein